MPLDDFKIEKSITVDSVEIDVSANEQSGGIVFNSSQNKFISSVGNIPVGVVRMWASGSTSPTVPADYLICDGRQNLIQDDYPALYAVIGDRFTTTPNATTFGLPSFNSSSFAYPFLVSEPTSSPMATTVNIGLPTSSPHGHSGTALTFNVNGGMNANETHAHVFSAGSDDSHQHDFGNTTANAQSHQHNTSTASTAHSHTVSEPGTLPVQTSQATANHDHTCGDLSSNHTHTTSNNGHTHADTGIPTLQDGSTSNHNHNLDSTLSSSDANHFHTAATCGFYFIIKYR